MQRDVERGNERAALAGGSPNREVTVAEPVPSTCAERAEKAFAEPKSMSCKICCAITSAILVLFFILTLSSRYRIEKFEQIMVSDEYGEKYTIEEAGVHWIWWWEDVEKRTADALGPSEYAVTYDTNFITRSVVHGPGRLWLGPYEQAEKQSSGQALSVREYMKVTNTRTKSQKIVRGTETALYRPAASAMIGMLSDDLENPAAYEEFGNVQSATQLNPQQYIAVTNDLTMTKKIVRGTDGAAGNGLLYMPCDPANAPEGGYLPENDPCAYEEIGSVQTGVTLTQQEYVAVTNSLDGSVKIVRGVDGPDGNGLLYMPCSPDAGQVILPGDPCAYEDIGDVQTAVMLTPHQYIVVENSLDGSIKVVRGIDGDGNGLQYMPCTPETDSSTGLPIPIGPADPCAFETFGPVQDARIVTAESALLVRAIDTGIVRLVDTPGPFFPGPYDEIDPEPRELIRVAEYETVVLAMEDGSFQFRAGAENGTYRTPLLADDSSTPGVTTTSGTSFFLPPYAQLLTFEWTVGYDVEDQGGTTESSRAGEMKTFSRLDQRMQQLFFQYDDVRTNDNIEFEVEGTIFWEIEDVPKLVTATNDPTGDIWHRMRSQISQAAGNYNYAGFLTSLRNMTAAVKEEELDNPFYSMRGIKVYDFQLIEVELKDEELEANIVDAMALEAIDRINRVNQEISESEVEIVRLQGVYNVDAARAQNERSLEELRAQNALVLEQNQHQLKVEQQRNTILLEQERTGYLDVVHANSMLEATTIGAKEGAIQGASINEYLTSLNTSDLSLSEAVRLYEVRLAYQNANITTSNIAMGAAELYLTSDDANLHLGDALHVNMPTEAPDSNSG